MTVAAKSSPKRASPAKPEVVKRGRLSLARFKEPSTWAGVLSIACALATGGASVLVDPMLQGQIISGLGLILAKEG